MLSILVTLVIIGVLLWGVQQIPMDATIKKIIYVLAIVFVVIWLLNVLLGVSPAIP